MSGFRQFRFYLADTVGVQIYDRLYLMPDPSAIFILNYIERCLRRATPTPTASHEKGTVIKAIALYF
ncbi:MAG: hypothetical protein V7L14_18445 [Nostoc sp.]|uniref:hypothetical protein n=1 Tax=Nostoc sp. TaxID=1180 RepID=UPI002FF8152F